VFIKVITLELSQKEAVNDQLDVIGNKLLVLIVPGADSANNERLAQDAETATNEFVAHTLCVEN
jgi:hypothetical protein